MTDPEPTPRIEVRELDFDDRNRAHLLRHGIDDTLCWDVLGGRPWFFDNPPAAGRTGTHLMIGADAGGRFWTIILVQAYRVRWRPITGWPSTDREIRRWHDRS